MPATGATWVEVPPAKAGKRYYVNTVTQVRPMLGRNGPGGAHACSTTQETRWTAPADAIIVPAKVILSPKAAASASTSAEPGTSSIMEGWLEKSNSKGRAWKQRYVSCPFRVQLFL